MMDLPMATEELELFRCPVSRWWQPNSSQLLVLIALQMNKPNCKPEKVVNVTVL